MSSTISDLNIVLQQGSRARDVQQSGRQPHEPAQAVLVQQEKAEVQQRTIIQPSDDPEKLGPDKDRDSARNLLKKKTGKQKKTASAENQEETNSGTIINTVV